MSRLPLLLSVPHAGLDVPNEVSRLNLLTPGQIADDGDGGARGIYSLADDVEVFVTTQVARAFVDMNRARDDRRKDGVVKTHTCWDIPIYREPLDDALVERLLDAHHHPYHARLADAAHRGLLLGIDCHTMAASGPPVGPDPGVKRPAVCLSNADGLTCPDDWLALLADCFRQAYHDDVRLNHPFKGGFITREQGKRMPWVQVELSRAPIFSDDEKRHRVLSALRRFVELVPKG